MNNFTKIIIDHSFEYAKDLLTDTGQCYPFGAYVDNAGTVHPMELEIDKKNIPNNETVIEGLRKYCETELQEKRIIAYGLTYEASVQLEVDSVKIDTVAIDIVDENDALPPIYYYPYSFDKAGAVKFGETFAVKR